MSTNRSLAWFLLLALLVPPAAGCGDGKGAKAAGRTRPAPLVSVSAVQVRDVPVEARAPVDLKPLALADIGSKTFGYLDAVLVDRGDRVRRGQLLATVRPSDLPDQLAALRGTLTQSEASLGLAKANAKRAAELAPAGVVSQQELESSSTSLTAAEANQEAIRAQISAVATRLGETRILSPLDGLVWQRRLDPGSLVGSAGAGGTIMTVVQTETLRLFINVNERQATRVHVGQTAWIEVDALSGRRFEGKVVRLAPGFDPNTRTLEAEVRIANAEGELRPGMYGRGAIVLEVHPAAIVVPAGAVQLSGGKSYVFVVKDDSVERRPVELGVDGGDWLEVTHGLAAGDRIVTAGLEGLSTGARIRIAADVDPYTGRPLGTADGGPGRPDGGR